LNVNSDSNSFACEHCGNHYLMDGKIRSLKAAELRDLSPLATYTSQLRQWLKVGNYDICLHEVNETNSAGVHKFSINVEYRNSGKETLSCRRNQWILFDADGYAYDGDYSSDLYEDLPGQPLGGDRMAMPGMHVRGWVAFKLPQAAVVDRLQFLTGYLVTKTAEFTLRQK
jgi:hypothetical protein